MSVSGNFVARSRRAIALLTAGLLAAGAVTALTSPTAAAAGPSWAGVPAEVILAQRYAGATGTQVTVVRQNAAGQTVFVDVGTPVSGLGYNAISYRYADNYIYGIETIPSGTFDTASLVQVDSTGTATVLGPILQANGTPMRETQTNGADFSAGSFGDGATADVYFVHYGTGSGDNTLWMLTPPPDPTQPYSATNMPVATKLTIDLPGTQVFPNTPDLFYADGHLWGVASVNCNGSDANCNVRIWRLDVETTYAAFLVDPASAAATTVTGTSFDLPDTWFVAADRLKSSFGGQWAYGNGNIGISNNNTGRVYQIAVTDGTATPTFTLVSKNSGGDPSVGNDATYFRGLPVDLGITKTVAPTYTPGDNITYTIAVTNHGPGVSSGWVMSDDLPSAVPWLFTAATPPLVDTTVVSWSGAACDVTTKPGSLTCSGGTLDVGATVTITVTIAAPDDATEVIPNTATVLGNESEGDNPQWPNTADATTSPAGLTVTKTATPAVITAADQAIVFSFTVSNTGQLALHDVTIADLGVTVGAGTLRPTDPTLAATDPVPCVTDLPVGATDVACTGTFTYTVAQADLDARTDLVNTARADALDPYNNPIPSDDATVTLPIAALTLVKSATPVAALPLAGQTVAYSFLVTNTGTVPLNDITINDAGTYTNTTTPGFSGTGPLAVTCPTTPLAPGAQFTCSATYTVTETDFTTGVLRNTATAKGTTDGGVDVTSNPSPVQIPGNPNPDLTLTKTPDKTELVKDEVITYTMVATNSGNVTLHNVTITDPPADFRAVGTLSAITCDLTAPVTLVPGQALTCTATYTVQQGDVDRGIVENKATATGTPATGPALTRTKTAAVPQDIAPALTLDKSVDKASAVAGDTLTYSFLVTNTGNVTLFNLTIDETTFTGKGTLSAPSCPTTELAPLAHTTCTATYQVTAADTTTNALDNTAVATAETFDQTPVPSPESTATVKMPGNAAQTGGSALTTTNGLAALAGLLVMCALALLTTRSRRAHRI